MGIRFYAPGEHPAGFIGFRVYRPSQGKKRQKYFSTKDISQDSVDFQMIEIKARIQDAEWQMDSIQGQYQTYVSSNHPNTKPGRGVGVHGITLTFFEDRRDSWTPAFVVQNDKSHPIRFTFASKTYSEAWIDAVESWAKWNEIEPEDKNRLLEARPDPSRFKELRKILIEEGVDIPVEALRSVFKEQREALKARRTKPTSKPAGLKAPSVDSGIADEVEAWFRRATQK